MNEKEELNIILIDHQPIYREGIKQVLETNANFQVLVSSDHYSVVQSVLPYRLVDVILIDVSIALKYGEKITEHLKQYPEMKMIVLASEKERKYVTEAIKIGAHGFLLKEMDVFSFIEAIRLVKSGTSYIHPIATEELVNEFQHLTKKDETKAEERAQCPLHLYTKRECEVLQLLAEGKSNRAIATALNISEKTVKNHVSNLFRKMNVNDRTHAVVLAIRNKWVEL